MSFITPMRLLRIPGPFDHPDFIFEPKLDGFRALAHVRGHRCELGSRNGHTFKQWPQLAEELAHAVRAHSAVLDGEICCLEPDGRTHFNTVLFRRDWPFFCAFDVLSIEGEDLTDLPLLERKRRLLRIMPTTETRLLYPIISSSAAAICFAWPASVTSKASSGSGRTARIRRTVNNTRVCD